MKVKMKISGSFRTLEGAQIFATLRSIVSTARKHGCNILRTLAARPDQITRNAMTAKRSFALSHAGVDVVVLDPVGRRGSLKIRPPRAEPQTRASFARMRQPRY